LAVSWGHMQLLDFHPETGDTLGVVEKPN